ncbi:MAG: hypothetical protein HY275_12665, partial [Gemmatimonadetes bacterium]|nr:hypothetical protein [Gemmatimonadota bacterium]
DTTQKTRVKTIVATGSARSFYQVQASNGDRDRPALNYVRGREITVQFDTSGVQTVDVDEKAIGLYLEPAPDSAKVADAKAAAAKGAEAVKDAKDGKAPAPPASRQAPAPKPAKPPERAGIR